MTKVEFTRSSDGLICSLDIRGHAGFAEEGEDIVCSAITSAVQLAHILLEDIRGLVIDTVLDPERTIIHLDFSDDVQKAAQDVMEALQMHYKEMQEEYAEFITVTEVQQQC